MFRSVSLNNRKIIWISALCFFVFAAVCWMMLCIGTPDTAVIDGGRYSLTVKDGEDIGGLLSACGYPDAQRLSEKEITVPKHWNEVYDNYQALQMRQGFDLVPYKGKMARQLSYRAGETYITILIREDTVIAAHICKSDGTNMQPLLPGC